MEDEFKNDITHSIKTSEPAGCRGGILADGMGMGKSLSLLALIIYTLNQTPESNGYPSSQKEDMWSCATLIVASKSTIHGWVQQVNKHTRLGALRVHIYHGKGRRIALEKVSQFDIVLTTYETAASDASISGHLSRIFWLRLVLDEGTKVNSPNQKPIYKKLSRTHGGSIIDATPEIQPTRENNICDKCGEPIDIQNASQQPFHGTCGHNVCYECTLDQNGAEGTILNSTLSNYWVCQEPVISVRLDSKLMDSQATAAVNPANSSSKIGKVVANLQKLERASPVEPIKSLGEDLLEQRMLYVRIDGTLTVEQRRTAIHQFSTIPETRILLLSYGSGSVGTALEPNG
ncbi:hypothetical protein BP6252_03510 [Coleophoma cylindrospora]|uniref:Helicase ATP-binding domain-containing protein n=1 Tax=Coleophoma cylindrospora TaxID=1849047 RepID=A0A3D8S9C4_9HELO|nr:hypothetical protein BP6252_03510 [Coleophoma cylindrospora]